MGLQRNLDTGQFVILAEMEPPKGADVSTFLANALKVKGAIDAFVIPEMSNAVMRMSSLGAAMLLQSKGMETVMQVCCRDRNRLALQADLLAAHACGITNVMAVTGEDPSFGDHHQAKAVYDINLLELLNGIKSLQNGRDMAGIELNGAPTFLVGTNVNTGAKGEALENELQETKTKIDAGVQFLITPPIFDLNALTPVMKHFQNQNVKIIPTVLLLKSVGMARYIAKNVPHIYLPEELLNRIQKAGDKVRECMKIAGETLNALKEGGFCGAMLSSMGWEHKLPEVIGGMGI